jgi:S-(hydroxymethyl)glutathione dehydrogenase/alcohol dehydrogenase
MLWQQPGEWEVNEVDLDDPGPTEVLVEMVASGLCHSDDHTAKDDMVQPMPFVGGHEGSGIVRQVGSEVHDLEVGDHIITSFIPGCGRCRWCASGRQNLCDNGALIATGEQASGGFRMHVDGKDLATATTLGTFAEWQVFDQMSVTKIDKDIPLDVACLVSCGVQTGFGSAVNAAEVKPGDVVLIMGAGGVGMNAVQGAARAGAAHVVVVDPAPFKREKAPLFGATETFADYEQAADFVRSVTNWQGADCAIVTIGVVQGQDVTNAVDAIRKGGTVVVTGLVKEGDLGVANLNLWTVTMFQKRIQGSLFGMASPREAMPMLLRLYQAGQLKLDELITTRYTLDDINQGYADMHAGRNIRGIIDYRLP